MNKIIAIFDEFLRENEIYDEFYAKLYYPKDTYYKEKDPYFWLIDAFQWRNNKWLQLNRLWETELNKAIKKYPNSFPQLGGDF